MTPDRVACLAFAACVAVVIAVTSAAGLDHAAGRLLWAWICRALLNPH